MFLRDFLLLNENDVCDLQVRIFLRNASCSTMLLCTAKDHWDSRTFSRGSTKFSLNNVQISTRISSVRTRCLWSSLRERRFAPPRCARYYLTNFITALVANHQLYYYNNSLFHFWSKIIKKYHTYKHYIHHTWIL